MNPQWLDFGAPPLARAVASRYLQHVENVLVVCPHSGIVLDEIDVHCLRSLSNAAVVVIVRTEDTEPRRGEGFIEFAYTELLDGLPVPTLPEPLEHLIHVDSTSATHPSLFDDLAALLRQSAGVSTLDDVVSGELISSTVKPLLQLLLENDPADAAAGRPIEEPVESNCARAALLYYWLVYIAHRAAALFHRLNADAGDPAKQGEALGKTLRTIRVVESASALRDAVRARWGTRTGRHRGDLQVPHLLFVDDQLPTTLRQTLRRCAKVLWHGAKLWLWDPLSTPFGLRELRNLGPNPSATAALESEIKVEDFTSDDGVCERMRLRDVLGVCSHVIVDQYFETDDSLNGLRGPEIIRFFARLERTAGRIQRRRPTIVAFSRNQEPDLVAATIRAGADGYVVKSVPAQLTEYVLGASPSGQFGELSRNFEGLEHLPPRTRDLLQSIAIPALAWDDWYATGVRASVAAAAQWLRAVPKAELHVHLGSCMSREFLVAASIIGLAGEHRGVPLDDVADFVRSVYGSQTVTIHYDLPGVGLKPIRDLKGGLEWMQTLASAVRGVIESALTSTVGNEVAILRAYLAGELRIPDFVPSEEAIARLKRTRDLSIVLVALRSMSLWSCSRNGEQRRPQFTSVPAAALEDVLLRCAILRLALTTNSIQVSINGDSLDKERCVPTLEQMTVVRRTFFDDDAPFSVGRYRANGWRRPDADQAAAQLIRITGAVPSSEWGHRERDPLGWTLASGLRAGGNLERYLEGADFSGSLHLRHPHLLHLYAEQLLHGMIRDGIAYRELRGSPDGYVHRETGFTFADACACLITAFSEAQTRCVDLLISNDASRRQSWLVELAFGEAWSTSTIAKALRAESFVDRSLPPKVGLLFVGKRHKSQRDMILEAAAGAMLYGDHDGSERGFDTFRRASVVGFDLAGPEAEFPPALFSPEFERLGKLHIPLTVHAGENASSAFVEDAVLLLGARRIGHALSLADDRHLMTRLREDRICVELCPVSNHQTCHFSPPSAAGGAALGRKYPLEAYLDAGIPVCLNTDNPTISRTNLIHEYFVAAGTLRKRPMTLWLALWLTKTAFRSSFLPLPQRRAVMAIVDEYIEMMHQSAEVHALFRRISM